MNSAGEMTGGYADCGGSGHGAVWFGQGGWITLPSPPPALGIGPADINSARHIGAYMLVIQNPETYRAAYFDYNTGEITNLGVLPGHNNSIGHAINEQNAICGQSSSSFTGVSTAFLWSGGQMSALDLPMGPNSEALDISDTGIVCGWMGKAPHVDGHAFLWSQRQVVDLGVVLEGALGASAWSISSNGQIVAGTALFQETHSAFLWHNGNAENLSVLPGFNHDRSLARGVNDFGIVVGKSSGPSLAGRGFIWRNGVMTDLNDLISSDLPLKITDAMAINNSGQIAANGTLLDNSGDQVALRLTPIPPPPGDCNCDGAVNMDDLLNALREWGPTVPTTSSDFDTDGDVDIDDLLTVINEWG